MIIQKFTQLPQDAIHLRINIFMHEQGFQNEFDELDTISTHFVGYHHHKPIAVCRLYYDAKQNAYIIGRLAIHKDYRQQGYGQKFMRYIIDHVQTQTNFPLLLHAQCRVIPFYQALGFKPFGMIDYDEHTPHQWMKKD